MIELRSLVDPSVELNSSDLSDIAALQLALDLTLADDLGEGEGRVEQIRSMLADAERSPWQTAKLCSCIQQTARLGLRPWQSPPCWLSAEEADAIIAAGPKPACDGSDTDISDCASARLLKRMMSLGVSRFHPDPIAAIDAARKTREVRAK